MIVGLQINSKKTKHITCGNISPCNFSLQDGSPVEAVADFKYLGAWIRTTGKDISVRKALAFTSILRGPLG